MNVEDQTKHSVEREASDHIEAGLAYECAENWQAAENEYRQVFALNPAWWVSRYSANNNLGYVLIQLEKFEEAANYCRAAIAIKPERYNAHKNLGLALQGQGNWKDAIYCFVEATRLNPANARAWQHLEYLIQARPNFWKQYPELERLVADIRAELEEAGYIQPPIEPSPMYRPMNVPVDH